MQLCNFFSTFHLSLCTRRKGFITITPSRGIFLGTCLQPSLGVRKLDLVVLHHLLYCIHWEGKDIHHSVKIKCFRLCTFLLEHLSLRVGGCLCFVLVRRTLSHHVHIHIHKLYVAKTHQQQGRSEGLVAA